jgi:Rha family phage regulatory protein
MYDMESVEHLVRLEGDRLMTDTLTVAKSTNKRHDNVLRAYDNLQCSAEFSLLNFEESDFVDERGKLRRLVKMTKDGFMLLVMGFKGEVAMAIKEAYIAAFNAMAAYIATHRQSLWQQMQAVIAQNTESKVKASFGSHLMLVRKRELPALKKAQADLDKQIQMPLFVM